MQVRLVTMIMRPRGLSRAAFLAQWREHARVVREVAPVLGIQRYLQLGSLAFSPANVFMRLSRGTRAGFDGVEMSWVERDDFARRLQTAEGKTALRSLLVSEMRFVDFARSAQWLATEHVLRAGKTSARPLIWAGRGLPALSTEAFQQHYLQQHGPLVAGNAELVGMDRYVQVHLLNDPLNEVLRAARAEASGVRSLTQPYPVCAEITFDLAPMFRREALRAGGEARRAIAADEQRHIDFSRSSIWQCEQRESFGHA